MERLKKLEAGQSGVDDFLAGAEPPETADPERRQMYRALKQAASEPVPDAPGPVGPHAHIATTTVDPA